MRSLWISILLLAPALSDNSVNTSQIDEEPISWKTKKLGTLEVVGCSTLSVITISVLPAILLCFIPTKNPNELVLKLLLAFGAGGLLGDALLHIIPHAVVVHSHGEDEDQHKNITGDHRHRHEEEHSHHGAHNHSEEQIVGLYVIAGILIFMVFEQFTRIFRSVTNHDHSNYEKLQRLAGANPIQPESERQSRKEARKNRIIRSSAYLNLVADCLHNVTDGIAIGASFSISSYRGLLITGAVLIHELPHEIGDFAILVESGFTKFQAISLQFVTALGALTGCYLAIWLAYGPDEVRDKAAKSWIMPLTAGGFIYIATVSVLPEILEANPEYSLRKQILLAILITILFVAGAGLMYLVAIFE